MLHLQSKQQDVSEEYNLYEYIENDSSDTLLIAYGALSRVAYYFKEDYAIYRPIRMFPMVKAIKDIAEKYENIIVMEMNAGQYVGEIEKICHREVKLLSVLGGNTDLNEIERRLLTSFGKKVSQKT